MQTGRFCAKIRVQDILKIQSKKEGMDMKVLLLNGSPHEKGCTYTALCEVAGALEKNGIETEIFQIGNKPPDASGVVPAAKPVAVSLRAE